MIERDDTEPTSGNFYFSSIQAELQENLIMINLPQRSNISRYGKNVLNYILDLILGGYVMTKVSCKTLNTVT